MNHDANPAAPGLRVVVVEPGGAVNVGAIARVMANFGFDDLVIVAAADIVDADGRGARVAMGGRGVFEGRRVVPAFEEALAGCGLVVGATRRARSDESCLDFREAATLAAREAARRRVALVLGRERDGLSREERARCHLRAEIPAVPGPAGSLNISHAAALFLCHLYAAPPEEPTGPAADTEALAAEFDSFFRRCGIGDENGRAQVVFRGLLARGGLTAYEADLLARYFRYFASRMSDHDTA